MFSLFDLPGISLPRTIEVIDVGARIEGTPRWSPLARGDRVHVTAFEPQADDRARLEATDWPITCLPHALGDGREATFHVTRWPGNCSLFRPDPGVVDALAGLAASHPAGNFFVVDTRRMATVRLDDVPNLPAPDFIKLDIQGAELQVLASGRRVLSQVLVVEAEAIFVPLYPGQPLFGELDCFMRSQGFVFHRFMNVAGRCYQPFALANSTIPVSQPLWADAIFVRNPFELSAWDPDDLLLGSVVLHELYGSFDLVLRLLVEHERRTKSVWAAAYVAALQQAGPIPSSFTSLAS